MAAQLEIEQLRKVTIRFLKEAFDVHQTLGPEGRLTDKTNIFREKTLKADWEAEEVFVKGCHETGIPIAISSEEHGEIVVGGKSQIKYRGVLDGIDGTNAYRMKTGPYGTMFAIFEGGDPRYEDYLVAGIVEYPSGRILIAARNQGAFILTDNQTYPAITSGEIDLAPNQTRIFIDGGFEFNRRFFEPKFSGFQNLYVGNIENKGIPWGVSSIYYFKLATGEADVVLECTRKRNLEIAVAFGILNEAGGIIVDGNGKSIANRNYLKFGQDPNEYLPVISAATESLAKG